MESQTNAPPPPARPAPAAPSTSRRADAERRTHWTPARQRIFLVALLETGSVTRAAHAAGMSRSSAYGMRRRLAGTPFVRLWDQVLAQHAERMLDPFAPDPATGAPQR
jgi:AraC-like DNA-binding protein